MEKIIRSVERSDAPAIRAIYAPFVSESATSFEIEPPDAAAMERRIQEQRDQFPWLVYEVGGEVLGYAYASPHRAARKAYQWCVEVSIYIHERARRRGIGRALYGSLFDLLRRQGYVNAYAGITLPNPGSLRLHESLGFAPIGVYPRIGFKFGTWHDVIWLQLRLQEADVPVAEPLPAKRLFEDGGVRERLREYALRGG
ncbi:MAG TPA: arsinothricin resistance N-acetyltransferase ArsN1 family B [Planctomycetota bacterium]|jgi:phosphinothricin acetyltransferase|nr:arsinothricin resistance N-acetyltransferase ArsN1 family B [Planctomycetota bacterium]